MDATARRAWRARASGHGTERWRTALGVIVALVVGANGARAAAEDRLISMIQLIAVPDTFDGKRVTVAGYLVLETEGDALYLHREDAERHIFPNGLWVDARADPSPKGKSLSAQYVIIEGTFNAKRHGHMGLWSGAIEKVTRMVPAFGLPQAPRKRPIRRIAR